MTEVTTQPARSSGSTTDGAKERLEEGAQQVQEKASEAKAKTRERLQEQIDTRSTDAGRQMTSTAAALRQTAQQLRAKQDGGQQAQVLEQIADRVDRFGRYLTETNGNRLLNDVERIARNRPWLVAGGGTVLGFLAARFTKASSSRRFEQNGGNQSRPALPRTTGAGSQGGGDVGRV
jgi:ElaB/YqjD/DUF883 family membrane-anchored ribosome-binding protein